MVVTACGSAAAPPKLTTSIDVRDRALASQLRGDVDAGIAQVEAYFGTPFRRAFSFRVVADRAAFDRELAALSREPNVKTECWVIGTGFGDSLVVLSPERWRDQACEHDPADRAATARFITHELVHTYHAQVNAVIDRDNAAAEALGWFVEGLATLVSGQLDDGKRHTAAEAIASGEAPKRLADAWSGKYRYGVSGSLVAYIDAAWGREVLARLLTARTPAELLGVLAIDEATLLERWRAWVTTR